MRFAVLATAATAALALALAATPAQAAVQPFGANDAGGFRNVLPPGEAGTDNAAQLAAYQALNSRPAHWMDQHRLYDNLVFASPGLTNYQTGDYSKDPPSGVPDGQTDTTETPRAGVTIVRDKQYGVPHIY